VDSPAVGLASDGRDAGAYEMTYGPLDKTWTLVSFATSGWRNPNTYIRKVNPVKLAEVDTFGGSTRSTAIAFKREFPLNWDGDTDMPAAQLTALKAIYETGDGECQLSLDGGTTWIPVRVMRGTEFSYTEITGLPYSDDSVPTPVGEMVFRESD
jgi:hypothetical protein